MITISSYWNSNPGLRITSYMKNIYIKVHSDNHYTTRAKKATPHAGLEPAILRLEVARVIQLRQWGT